MILRALFSAAIIASCVATTAIADEPTEANRLDPQLDGVWSLKSMQRGDRKIEGDEMPERMRGTKRTIKGKQMIIARGGDPRRLECVVSVDTATKPKQMNVSMERNGKSFVLKCIYEIKNGVLRIAENDQERPMTFDSESTRTLVTTYARQEE